MSGVIHVNSLKTAREALCLAEGAIRYTHGPTPAMWLIAAMIRDIDEQRPLGPDGKHGNRHTPTCGCETVEVGS